MPKANRTVFPNHTSEDPLRFHFFQGALGILQNITTSIQYLAVTRLVLTGFNIDARTGLEAGHYVNQSSNKSQIKACGRKSQKRWESMNC